MSSYDGSGARDTYSTSGGWRRPRPYLTCGWEYKRVLALYACLLNVSAYECESPRELEIQSRESEARIPNYINALPRRETASAPEMSDIILETDRVQRMNV